MPSLVGGAGLAALIRCALGFLLDLLDPNVKELNVQLQSLFDVARPSMPPSDMVE